LKIQKSAEDYLETMLILQKNRGFIRSIDIAEQLGVTKPSVSYATKRLRENGYITMEKSGAIKLLEPGRKIAENIYERHKVLTEFFVKIGVDHDTAAKDACKVEHDLSPATFKALKRFAKKAK
jgi:Mn-dependent DtxR family transcriptional regulator